MENLKNIKIKRSLYTFGGTLITLVIFTCIISFLIIRELNSDSTEISVNWLPSVIIAEELNTATSDFRIAEAHHVITQDVEEMAIYENLLEEIALNIRSMFDDYSKNLITNDVDAYLLKIAEEYWYAYLEVHARMINFSRTNDTENAMDIMKYESELLFIEVSNAFLDLVIFNKDGVEQANLQGDNIYAITIFIILVISIFCIIVLRKFYHLTLNIENTQEKLTQAHEEALLSSQAKSNFLANMSHEIRTPMNAISGMTDIIIRESSEYEVSEYAQNIRRACDSLLSIINDVLDISKIESGKLEIIDTEYSLSDVLNDVLNIATNRLEDKNLMFITNFQNDLPDKLIGDDVRVKQVMVNILNNAIKFTHQGHISFDVSGEFENGYLNITFSVTDTGVGISNEDIDKLFVEFERVNTTKNRTIEGTGLGLAISKRLCEMMGGSIKVASTLGKGTTFSITIRQKYAEYVQLAETDTSKSILIFESRELYLQSIKDSCTQLGLTKIECCSLQSEFNEALNEHTFDYVLTSSIFLYKVQEMFLKINVDTKIILLADNSDIKTKYDYATILLPANSISIANALNGKSANHGHYDNLTPFIAPDCKILIVDDNLVNLKVAQGLMKPYQFQTDIAQNGKEAVEKIQNEHYDLVFMDHMMPIMDGIDATIAIRSLNDEYFKKLPIVALTANAIVGTKEMFIKEGMNDFLAKPIKLKALNDILNRWLPQNKKTTVDISSISSQTSKESTELVIPNIDVALGLKRTACGFDAYIGILDIYYKNGIKNITSIKNFYDNKQLHDFRIEVHALKSSSATIGALDISQKAKLLEDASSSENWVYVNQNTSEFIDDFNILLEDIRNSLKSFITKDEENSSDKDYGDDSFYRETLEKIKSSFDNFDIDLCNELLSKLFEFNWDEDILNNLLHIKELISEYNYDEGSNFISTILK